MDANGLIVEDGYFIVGRAGQRVLRPGGSAPGREASPIGTEPMVGRSERGTDTGAPIAQALANPAGVPGVSSGRSTSVGLNGSGPTRPGY